MALLHHWPCQDNAASATVDDIVGSVDAVWNYNYTPSNTSLWSVADGPGAAYPRSIKSDNSGNPSYLSLSANTITPTTSNTFCCWLKFPYDASVLSQGLFGFFGGGVAYMFGSSETMYFGGSTTGYNLGSLSGWHHLAVVVSSGTAQLYVDGVSQGSAQSIGGAVYLDGMMTGYYAVKQYCDIRWYDSNESGNLAAIIAAASGASFVDRTGPILRHIIGASA